MRKLFSTKKRIAVAVGTVALVAASAGTAFAYFTSSGSGTGDATNAVGSSTTVTVDNFAVSGLVPGGPAESVSYSFTNGVADQTFGAASVVINSISGGAGTCSVSLFDPTYAASSGVVGEVSANATYNSVSTSEPTIAMGDNGNQNNCEGATLNLTVTIAAGS